MGEYNLPRLPHDTKDCGGDEETYNRVSKGIAQPYSQGSKEHGKARPTINSCMVSVCDEGSTSDLLPNPDAKGGYNLVSKKANHCSSSHCPKIFYCAWVEETLD